MDIDELRVTASLARLEMSDEELAAHGGAFEMMLEYFSAMQKADRIIGESPEAGGSGGVAKPEMFRDDAFRGALKTNPGEIIEKAGETDGNFIVIPNVL